MSGWPKAYNSEYGTIRFKLKHDAEAFQKILQKATGRKHPIVDVAWHNDLTARLEASSLSQQTGILEF